MVATAAQADIGGMGSVAFPVVAGDPDGTTTGDSDSVLAAIEQQRADSEAGLTGATEAVLAGDADAATAGVTFGAEDDSVGTADDSVGTEAPAAAVAGTVRVSGADRYEVAVAISENFLSRPPVVYIASGLAFADALSAAPAAAFQGGPLLLVRPGEIPNVVRSEIARLKPRSIVVAGGPASVSAAVYRDLATMVPAGKIRRDSGADRYEVSRNVVKNAFGSSGALGLVFVATGANFPDALSAGAAAGSLDVPVLLVNGAKSSIDANTRQLLGSLGVSGVAIAGGPASVTPGIESSLRSQKSMTQGVMRFTGADRYQVSAAINAKVFARANGGFFATGTTYADALTGAALAGVRVTPLWVVPSSCVPRSVLSTGAKLGITTYVLLGGPASLGAGVQALKSCG